MRELLKKLTDGKIFQSAFLPTSEINFSKQVREACECNYCGKYAKNWACPPGVGEIAELKKRYTAFETVFVFTTKHDLEDDYDFDGMMEGRKEHGKILDYVREELDRSGLKYAALCPGACDICEKCTYPDAPCRFPLKMIPSVEACGIDVTDLARSGGINYKNGEKTVTYFSCIFF